MSNSSVVSGAAQSVAPEATDQLLWTDKGSERTVRASVGPSSLADNLGKLRLGRFSGLFLIVVLIVVFGAWIPGTFLTTTSFQAIAQNQAITIVLSLALMASLTAGVFDLSIGQNFGLGTVVCIYLISSLHWNPVAACVATVLLCGIVGALNALLIVAVGIDSFIATLGVGSALLAAAEFITNNAFVGPVPASYQIFVGWQPLGIPVLIIYALVLAVVAWYVLEQTPFGRRLYATGANREAARLAGIDTKKYVGGALILTGLGAGIAAVLLSAQVGSISSAVGSSNLLPPFAACFLAATQIKPGRYNVGGLLVALVLLGIGVKGLSLLTGAVWIPDLFNGLALIVAVGLAVIVQRRSESRSKRRAISVETGSGPAGIEAAGRREPGATS